MATAQRATEHRGQRRSEYDQTAPDGQEPLSWRSRYIDRTKRILPGNCYSFVSDQGRSKPHRVTEAQQKVTVVVSTLPQLRVAAADRIEIGNRPVHDAVADQELSML